mgnify:CR=1 FL=1
MKLLNIGFGNMVSAERLIAVVSPDSAPIKRLIQESRERGMLIDATYGRSVGVHHGQRPCGALGHRR